MEFFALNWRTSLNMDEKLLFILNNAYMTDVTLRVTGSDTEFKAHSVFLGMASSVFEKMLVKKESTCYINSKILKIRKSKPKIVYHLLQYIYGNDVCYSNSWEVCDLFELAARYKMSDLRDLCLQYMNVHIDPTNVCLYLQTALHYDLIHLREKALKLIFKQTEEVIAHMNFLEIEQETLVFILDSAKQKDINVKEVLLFKAVDVWIKNSVAKKGINVNDPVCKILLRRICYLKMTREEFTCVAVESGLLPKETIDVVNKRFNSQNSTVSSRALHYKNNSNIIVGNTVTIGTLSLTTTVANTDGWKKVFLSVKEDAALSTLKLFTKEGDKTKKYEEEISIKIKDNRSDDWECKYEFNDIVSFSSTTNVDSDKPFKLLKNNTYIMEIYSSGGYRKTVNLDGINLSNGNLSLRFDRFAMWSPYIPLFSLKFKC